MPFKDTRLGPGTLLLGTAPGVEYGFQVSACKLVPTVNTTDGTPTLAVPEPPVESDTTFALEGTAINDFTDPTGLQRWCYDEDGNVHDFTWTPNTADAAVLTGQCTIQAFEMGGDVAVQITTDFSFPTVGKPVWTGGSAQAADEQTRTMKRGAK
jgi:hypothetical protein